MSQDEKNMSDREETRENEKEKEEVKLEKELKEEVMNEDRTNEIMIGGDSSGSVDEGRFGDLADVESFEDLLEVVGTSGRWNLFIFFLCSYSASTPAFQILSSVFLGATPDHWCHIGPLLEANWTHQQILTFAIPYNNHTDKHESCRMYDIDYRAVAQLGYEGAMSESRPADTRMVPCSYRDFNLTQYQSTVTTQWDLVCERRAIYSTTQAAVQGGWLLGHLIHGYLLDRFGRRPVVLWSAVLYVVSGFMAAIAPNVELYIFLLVVIALTSSGSYLGSFILLMETCAIKERSKFGTLFVLPWTLAYMMVPGIAYLVRTWQLLQLSIILPGLLYAFHYWLLPESPRWLILHNQHHRALEVLRGAAKINRKQLPPDRHIIAAMHRIKNVKLEEWHEQQKSLLGRAVRVLSHVSSLIRLKALRQRSLIVFFCWFSASMVYYGISLSAPNHSTNTYMYIFLGGLLEVPSYLLLWPAIVFLGRIKPLTFLYFVSAITILLVSTFIIFIPDTLLGVMTVVSLSGKMAITAAFHLMWVVTAELFPTRYRSLAVGQASVVARIGSILSPYINDILGMVAVWAPPMVFGLMSLVAGGLCLLLPESKGRQLPESVHLERSQPGQDNEDAHEGLFLK